MTTQYESAAKSWESQNKRNLAQGLQSDTASASFTLMETERKQHIVVEFEATQEQLAIMDSAILEQLDLLDNPNHIGCPKQAEAFKIFYEGFTYDPSGDFSKVPIIAWVEPDDLRSGFAGSKIKDACNDAARDAQDKLHPLETIPLYVDDEFHLRSHTYRVERLIEAESGLAEDVVVRCSYETDQFERVLIDFPMNEIVGRQRTNKTVIGELFNINGSRPLEGQAFC